MYNYVKRVICGSRDPLLEFWDAPCISISVEARNYEFGTEMDGSEC